jgi:hypothetical protein
MKKKSIIDTIEKEILTEIVSKSDSLREVITTLGLHPDGGGTSLKLKIRLKRDNISSSHFTGKRNNKHEGLKEYINTKVKKDINSYLVLSDVPMHTSTKHRIIKEGLLENKCCECGQLPYHNGKELVLQLDHINGNSCDNRIENLRILCPNCHTQTHNFSGKNKKVNITKNKCCYCGVDIGKNSKICKNCYDNRRVSKDIKDNIPRKLKFNPEMDELQKLVGEMPLTEVGERYGVTDNAIRKRCKKLGITIPKFPTGYWLRK